MKRIRIGKDISMRWEITTDGVAIPLDGRDLTVEIKSPMGIENNIPYRVDGNILIMTYYGYEQKRTGEYSITLWEKKGKPGQNVVDVIRAFKLVETSQEEDDFVGGDLQIESVDLGTENFDILTEGGYRAINIDTLQAEALEDSVNINGKTYSNESFTITLPKANLDSAGVMSVSDVRTLKEHADSIAQIKTSCEENAADIERVSNVVDTHESRLGGIDAEISSLNTEVSALQSKADENTTSISQINNSIADHEESIAQINTTLEEHSESINAKITTDRIEDGAVTSDKIATSAFDDTLSVSGKIAPADVVGAKLTELEEDVNKHPKEANDEENTFSICDMNGEIIAKFNNGFEVTSDGNIIIKGGFSSIVCQEKIDELNKKIDKSVGDYLSEAEDVDNIFSICDKRGDIIAKFNSSIRIESALAIEKDGVIKTENFNSSYTTSAARARFPRINFKKSPLRILDIGNSHSLCSEAYLGVILESQGVNIDDIAFCCISRGAASFKSFYQGWHDQDTSGEGDELTGGAYLVSKQFGGLDIKVSGNTYISNGDGTFTFDKKVENQSLTSNILTCWGGDTGLIRDLMTKNQFDIILIHGQDGYLEYEESNRWRDHSDFGYMTELIRLIKTYQPSATLTYLYPLIYFNYYQKYKTLEQMDECHKIWCSSLRKFMADSGVEYVIPSGTALLNLRHSSCLSAIDSTEIEDSTSGTPIMRPFESASDFAGGVANYETRFGLHYDIPHTAFGIAGYTMSCAIYEFLFAPRFDKSIFGNSLREEFKYLNFGGRNHLYLKPMKKDANGNMIPCTTYNTFSAELGWDKGRRPTIRVTDANAEICQMAAILAVNDIWGINNPDGVTI